MLGILTGQPSTVFSKGHEIALLLERVFSYRSEHTPDSVGGLETTVYTKRHFSVWKRNFTLWLIPTMYSIAKDERQYLAESYDRLVLRDFNDYDCQQQVAFSTIRHNRHTMSVTQEFIMPNLYGTCMYPDHILSPFCRVNRFYYRYRVRSVQGDSAMVSFRPTLFKNTQLVRGYAWIAVKTGRVISVTFDGEYDMMRFHTEATMGSEGARSLLPRHTKTHLVFRFMGNHVYFDNEALYDCKALPDTLRERFDAALMDSLRPVSLNEQERLIVEQWQEQHKPDTTTVSDTTHSFNFAKDVLRDAIGDNLVSSIRFETKRARLKLSPILDPQYISYSSSHGLSYRLKMGAYYDIDGRRTLDFQPWCGYNFKYKKFYFTLPLYYKYNPERNGLLTMVYGNGNRIGSSSVIEEIMRTHGDTISLDDQQLDFFDDNYIIVSNNIQVVKGVDLTTGFAYHHRVPYNPDAMWHYDMPRTYDSFAPMITLRLQPWRYGPLLTIDYETGLKGVFGAETGYDRWEFDASWKHRVEPLRMLNARFGYGFYTRKETDYFVDYAHFRDNKLPGGWEDDWSGDFQLLNSAWYNASRYYARGHFSYESPFLAASWFPLMGRVVERERLYFSALSIQFTRPYYELGYGFTTRLVSIGLFASFLSHEFQQFGGKFTFELFRRW